MTKLGRGEIRKRKDRLSFCGARMVWSGVVGKGGLDWFGQFWEGISQRGLESEQSHEWSVAIGSLGSAFNVESYCSSFDFRLKKIFDANLRFREESLKSSFVQTKR